jgi:hypothetical protein
MATQSTVIMIRAIIELPPPTTSVENIRHKELVKTS